MTNTKEMPESGPFAGITMTYTNWRGETRERRINPVRLRWGSTEWHPEPGWLLVAFDREKCERREFALADCDFTSRADLLAEAMRFVEMVAGLLVIDGDPDERALYFYRLSMADSHKITAGDVRAARALSSRLRGESA